jgi:hypothetical protein
MRSFSLGEGRNSVKETTCREEGEGKEERRTFSSSSVGSYKEVLCVCVCVQTRVNVLSSKHLFFFFDNLKKKKMFTIMYCCITATHLVPFTTLATQWVET